MDNVQKPLGGPFLEITSVGLLWGPAGGAHMHQTCWKDRIYPVSSKETEAQKSEQSARHQKRADAATTRSLCCPGTSSCRWGMGPGLPRRPFASECRTARVLTGSHAFIRHLSRKECPLFFLFKQLWAAGPLFYFLPQLWFALGWQCHESRTSGPSGNQTSANCCDWMWWQ